MTPDQPHPSTPEEPTPKPLADPTWTAFHDDESRRGEELEAAYRVIESYNATLLNQVAGLERDSLTFVESLSDNPQGTPPDISNATSTLFYLRPNTEEALHGQGEDDRIIPDGNPHVISGPMPERSQQVIDGLLAATGAVKDVVSSDDTVEIWLGKVAGIQPVKFVIEHTPFESSWLDSNGQRVAKYYQQHSMRAYRIDDIEPGQ